MSTVSGIIIHAISGFYYVEAADRIYECKAKGAFRSKNISPLVGDRVQLALDGDKGRIETIEERKNFLLRPPVANLDRLIIVSSVERPKPNLFIIDKLSAFAVYHHIEPVIVFSKSDLGDTSDLEAIYQKAGFLTLSTDIANAASVQKLRDVLANKICAFAGNSRCREIQFDQLPFARTGFANQRYQ